MGNSRSIEYNKIILSPVFLIALFVLLINDHFLKQYYPSFITGKLSDFAGLYVFAVFIFVLFRKLIRTNQLLMYLHVGIAIAFIVWKIFPVEIILNKISILFAIPVPGRTKDLTDLIALVILLFSYRFLSKFIGAELSVKARTAFIKACAIFILLLSGFSIMATSKAIDYPEILCGDVNDDNSINVLDVVMLIEYLYKDVGFKNHYEAGDVTRPYGVTNADILFLSNYIFSNGPDPECPDTF